MNRHDPLMPHGSEAQLEYLDGDYRIIKQGNFVRCAVTTTPILMDDLRYWSVERQEAYVSADAVMTRFKQLGLVVSK
jgi:hypothetical protein